MKAKLLFFIFLTGLLHIESRGQYLPSYYQGHNVAVKNVQNNLYMEGNVPSNGNVLYVNTSNVDNNYFNQQFKIENGATSNYYRLKHLVSGKYVTVIVSPGDAELRDSGDCPNTDFQEFRFIQQPMAYWYKLHAHFSHGGIDEVLTINNGVGTGGGLKLQPNITVGADVHQRWYLTNLNPDVSPSPAIPSLEDKFEGRTVGFTEQQYNNNVKGYPAYPIIYASGTFTDFEKEFNIDYSDEVGWYLIRHKASNKYVTINDAYPRSKILLKPYFISGGETQKFKFVYISAGKYEIHSKYSQGPEVGNNGALLLNMAQTDANFHMTLGADNTPGGVIGVSSSWQTFKITRYINPALPAEFTGGANTFSGKITGKQYYITARETLALLEPYKVGNDTFVRVQQNPVYGEQSEWVIDPGRPNSALQPTYRIRYGKTGQYLYVPFQTENIATSGVRLKLISTNDTADKRLEFLIEQKVPGPNWTALASRVEDAIVHTDDEGFVEIASGNNANKTYFQDQHFCFNLSIPGNQNNTFAIVTKSAGHFLSDSGKRGSNIATVHAQYADYSIHWHFIPAGGTNTFYIQNDLTKQYLSPSLVNGTISDTAQTQSFFVAARDKWIIVRKDNNYYEIQSEITVGGQHLLLSIAKGSKGGKEMTLIPNNSVSELDHDINFIISRTNYEYLKDPVPLPVYSPGILNDYSEGLVNALNSSSYLDNLMKNVGLPFEPSLQTNLFGTATGNQHLADEGFATTGYIPSFLPVIKSAMMYTYNYSAARTDSALRNYKLDTAGHRVDVTNALKNYIIKYLSPRAGSTWTLNETALVNWLERKIKAIRVNYGNRLDASWDEFLATSNEGDGTLTFSNVFFPPFANTDLFGDVEYFPINADEEVSIMEYTGVNRFRDYKNPGTLATLTVPVLSGAGLTMLGFFVGRSLLLARVPAQLAAKVIITVAEKGIGIGLKTGLQTAAQLTKTIIHATSFSNAATAVSVISVAIEILVMQAMEAAEFINFQNELNDKVDRCINAPIVIQATVRGSNLIEQIALNQDLDYLFAIGKRFDNINGTVSYIFNGNGNWSLATNWKNGLVPPNPLPSNKEIIINPVTGGSCILDIPYSLSADNYNSRIKVNAGKSFFIQSTLTVPNAKVVR